MDKRHKDQALRLANIGYWELDVIEDEFYWSEEIRNLHEVEADYKPNLKAALAFYIEGEHRKKIERAVKEAIEDNKNFSVESRLITARGNKRWVKAIGKPKIEDGRCVRIFGSTQNITEQKEAEEQARRTRLELQDIVEHSTIMFYRHDNNHNLLYVSPQSKQYLGCSPEKAKKQWMEFATDHPKNKEGFRKTQKAIETGEVQTPYELQLQRTDGSIIWVQVNESPVVVDGETVEIVGSLTDITGLKEKQRQVKEKEIQLRNITNNIDGMVHRYVMHPDKADEITFISEGVKELHEVEPEEVLKSPDLLWSQIAADHIEKVRNSVKESADKLTSWDHKWKIETPSGQQKWIHGRGTPEELENGSVQWDTVLLDVTNQKELEQNISRQVSLLNSILDSIPGLFYMIREDLTFARTNKNVESFFNLTSEQLQTTNALTFIAPRVRSRAKKLISKAFEEGYAELETVLIDGEGQEKHYYMTASRMRLDEDRYLIGSGINITERVKAEEENTVLLREVHHRVKNNLAIISGILKLELEELPLENTNRLALERSVNRIHSIAKVHELLYQTSSFAEVSVKKYISDLATTVIETMQSDKMIDTQLEVEQIEMNINEVIPLGMLINELLTNSLKYAFQDRPDGRIEIGITQVQNGYKVYYRDNGRGFSRADFMDSKTLGLTIVKMLLKQLQAEYEVDTEDRFELSFIFEEKITGSHSNIS